MAAEATFEGIGLHTGEQAQLRILPGEANSGYVFVRMDLEGAPEIPAHVSNVSETRRGTTLKSGEATIHTTEHVLAALYALGLDNARLELDGPEVPILDGSALPFMEGLESAGSTALDAPRRFFKVRKNLSFRTDDGVEMLIVPLEEDEFKATVMVDYNSPVLGTQHARLENLKSFKEDIASCRTFVFLKEVASLAEQGLIKGGDVDNAVVLAERAYSEAELKDIAQTLGRDTLSESAEHPGVVSTSDLRFDNEPARHKLLDIVGDLALTGRFIQGHVLAARPTRTCRQCGVRQRIGQGDSRTRRFARLPNRPGIPDGHQRHRGDAPPPLPLLAGGSHHGHGRQEHHGREERHDE